MIEQEQKEKKEEDKVNTKYELKRKLGEGSFGTVYLGVESRTGVEVAIKVEKVECAHPQLQYESKVLKHLNQEEREEKDRFCGFPQIISCSVEQEHHVMVMQLLGPSIQDIFQLLDYKFSLKTTLMVGIQLVTLLEALHTYRFIHRDIKPSNFAIGCKHQANVIYMIDFGLSRKYMDREERHSSYKEGKKFVGNVKYCSLNSHLGVEQSRRDDLESVAYLLIYLAKGSLPWQQLKGHTREEKQEKVQKAKAKPVDLLCQGLPPQFGSLLLYAKSLQFEQQPDYDMCRTLLHQLCNAQAIQVDHSYDWNTFIKSRSHTNNPSHNINNEEYEQQPF